MDMYGTILKKRIKEMGYTQERFAEETGVPFGTLKKYLSNKAIYPIDLLEIFAEKLECSYDYLMGYTVSPKREYQDLKDVTRLSDEAIERLKQFGSVYNRQYGKMASDTVSKMLEMEDLVESVSAYFYADELSSKKIKEFVHAVGRKFSPDGKIDESELSVESILMMAVMDRFIKCKNSLNR